ncbi:hypothetical protein L486_04265 [Kwoniella mangroviensis CBS 10435]|uniref:HpcH/HpaI aldolase/citrate lyase domain-containing protein n=1 Tax=Kwoniella mangroviensis CBS 10435 TaxID=1331196 RepID=A0A1B9IRR6_9TREE|nr:hypothetical protein L486_04265 [Kwoniella mangroviensis CBS 10435]
MFGVPAAPAQDPPMLNYRGHALHHTFDLRSRMKISREKPMIGTFFAAFPHPALARMVGQAGYDYVLLDWEHTPFSRTAVVVRVPVLDHQYAAWVLDAGASGIIFPHISTVEQAQQAIEALMESLILYSRLGNDLNHPTPCGYNDGAPNGGSVFEIWGKAAIILQIEDEEGAKNAAALAALEEVDGLMVGPGDLALSLGLSFGNMAQDERWLSSVGNILTAAQKHNKASLMPGMTSHQIGANLQNGVTMLCASNDFMIMAIGLRKELVSAHEQLDSWKKEKQTASK